MRQSRSAAGASNQSALQRFAPPIPRLSPAGLQAVLAESERPIRAWLDENADFVRGLSVRAATAEVMRRVPEARDQGAGTVTGIVQSWAAERGITLPRLSIVPHPADTIPPAPAGPSLADSDIVAAVERAIEIATEGVRIDRSHGFAQINVSGATVGLRRGALEAASSIGWSGEMALRTRVHDVHFGATLSAERWSLSLTFPSDQMPADMSRLGTVFSEGERALRTIAGEVHGMRSLSEIPDVAERVSPHLDPVKEAVEAASSVAGTRTGVSFGIRAEGPAFAEPGAGGAPAATSIQGVLTIVF